MIPKSSIGNATTQQVRNTRTPDRSFSESARPTQSDARSIAEDAIQRGLLESIARPVVVDMIKQCRNRDWSRLLGTAPNNEILWQRYGGHGAGVCVEFEVPVDMLGVQLHRVQYATQKRLHIDHLLRAFVGRDNGQLIYNMALLSKPSSWAGEEEIRFVSQRHSVSVVIDRAQLSWRIPRRRTEAGRPRENPAVSSSSPAADRER